MTYSEFYDPLDDPDDYDSESQQEKSVLDDLEHHANFEINMQIMPHLFIRCRDSIWTPCNIALGGDAAGVLDESYASNVRRVILEQVKPW